MVHEPHDALFKDTFSNLDHAAEEFRAVLPPALVRALDWSSLALESSSFVTLDVEAPVRSAVERYLPAFEYLLDDLTAVPDEALKQRPMSAESRLVLGALKRGPRGDWQGLLLEWPEVLEEVLGGVEGLQKFAQVLLYLMNLGGASPGQIEDVLKEHVMSEPIEKAFLSTADQLRLQGYERGRTEQSRANLRKLLVRRFGPLAPELDARIEQAALAQLDRWIEEVVVASSLDEVFRA